MQPSRNSEDNLECSEGAESETAGEALDFSFSQKEWMAALQARLAAAKKLVEASLQEWAQELPEGSYRYPSSWLEERGSWLKNGMPMRADVKAT